MKLCNVSNHRSHCDRSGFGISYYVKLIDHPAAIMATQDLPRSDDLSERVRMPGVKHLVGPHDGDQILGVAEVDDVVGVAGQHVDGLNAVAGDLELQDLVAADPALLNEAVAGDDDEELPLGVVPMLALGDAGSGDIHGKLAVVGGFE